MKITKLLAAAAILSSATFLAQENIFQNTVWKQKSAKNGSEENPTLFSQLSDASAMIFILLMAFFAVDVLIKLYHRNRLLLITDLILLVLGIFALYSLMIYSFSKICG